jgi:hypothetical protein
MNQRPVRNIQKASIIADVVCLQESPQWLWEKEVSAQKENITDGYHYLREEGLCIGAIDDFCVGILLLRCRGRRRRDPVPEIANPLDLKRVYPRPDVDASKKVDNHEERDDTEKKVRILRKSFGYITHPLGIL